MVQSLVVAVSRNQVVKCERLLMQLLQTLPMMVGIGFMLECFLTMKIMQIKKVNQSLATSMNLCMSEGQAKRKMGVPIALCGHSPAKAIIAF